MKKYVVKNDKDYTFDEHAKFCQKFNLPFIIVTRKGENFSEILYNIVNMGLDDEKISDSMRKIFKSYCDFYLMPFYLYEEYLTNNYYFISFPVYNKHLDCIANQLFDFLISSGENSL